MLDAEQINRAPTTKKYNPTAELFMDLDSVEIYNIISKFKKRYKQTQKKAITLIQIQMLINAL